MSRMTVPATEEKSKKNKAVTGRHTARSVAGIAYGSSEHMMLVLDGLNDLYGYDSSPADIYATGEPLDGLLLTLLSQNTNDRNRDRAYEALRAEYPSWALVAALSSAEIAALIKPAGLGDTKSSRMKAILGIIRRDFGDHSLREMAGWQPDAVRAYLSNLPGIGPKTVACVMVFDLDMPAFPVDTHVARVSRRVGWVREKETPEKIQNFLETVVPPGRCRGGHLNMIEHGRKQCHSRKPNCGTCGIRTLCKFYENDRSSGDNVGDAVRNEA